MSHTDLEMGHPGFLQNTHQTKKCKMGTKRRRSGPHLLFTFWVLTPATGKMSENVGYHQVENNLSTSGVHGAVQSVKDVTTKMSAS